MKKRIIVLGILMLSMAVMLQSGCGLNKKRQTQKAIAAYVEQVQPAADVYFRELVKGASGEEPESVTIGWVYGPLDFFKAPALPIEELLTGCSCIPTVGLDYPGEEDFPEEAVKRIINESVKRGLQVYLYFDGKTDIVYEVSPDKVEIDFNTGIDGGTFHKRFPFDYSLDESEPEPETVPEKEPEP